MHIPDIGHDLIWMDVMSTLPSVIDVENIALIILPHIHSFNKMWYFTNHGENHCTKVLEFVDNIIEICDLCGIRLTEAEKIILKCASWLHDLGRIREREDDDSDHALESVKIIRILSDKGHLNLGAIKNEVEYVVSTHSTKGLNRLDNVEKERPISGVQEGVRLKLLCALFKIADECDIDRLRAPKPVYDILEDKMPSTSMNHWLRHRNVIKVEIAYEEGKIIAHMLEGYGDENILDSLNKTLADEKIVNILTEYSFPITSCYIHYHSQVDITEDG